MPNTQYPELDEASVERIVRRVVAAMREDLHALALAVGRAAPPSVGLTVDEVAVRLGCARSTVYAHWREWGGYKLGPGEKAPIRFDSSTLPSARSSTPSATPALSGTSGEEPARPPRRRDLLSDSPRPSVFLDLGA